jgi:hypothetical protein
VDVGFDTIGNATLICYDQAPVLVTDPWLTGNPYFGSWTLSHDIPAEQLEAINQCRFIWLSHAHPDHLSAESLRDLRARQKRLLLPDHVGGRLLHDLRAEGHDVHVLTDRVWYRLSDRIKVMSIADYNQDALLLVDVNGRLVVNKNDAGELGWERFVRNIVREYRVAFLLSLAGFGDANMINFFAEDGTPIPPAAARRFPVGRNIAFMTDVIGARFFIPFSSMHRYQRQDSLWANRYVTGLADYPVGFDSRTAEILPAFVRYDCRRDDLQEIRPPERTITARDPREYGDDWTAPLEPADVLKAMEYFGRVAHLGQFLDFIRLRVGGREHVIPIASHRFERGITFEAPRTSLMTAITHEIFDDLLIGNFMKATLHGRWPTSGLQPHFTQYVAKYADNGGARSRAELRRYFAAYRRRAPLDYVLHCLRGATVQVMRAHLERDSAPYQFLRRAYRAYVQVTAGPTRSPQSHSTDVMKG